VLRVHLEIDQEQGRVLRGELTQRTRRRAHCIAISRFAEFLARAEADQQHALGRYIRQPAQQQGRAGLA